ncbi:uncharacterized protein K489DRAFT_431780 [Dissoconium aciculare CBS 342.82]|uniref:Uncharacterized protein n=1 Tax=Dissoconium aciculare CBS 342.82 TaxID=1314786 RepID=A0A6J3M8P4_9PEZI|nr:uncharacterized protein K489DRAFT_431780 [Dissoconium aciculare CBS 342.82]KAF1823207.1 hypothetical protein K489DRAFT_431780 [Dissoconium aciculare CBS 342.82]
MSQNSSEESTGSSQLGPYRPYKHRLKRPGQIFWIPRKENAGGDLGLSDSAHNHPCVVLSDVRHNGKHAILIMTSLGGDKLVDRKISPMIREKILPVSPTEPHPDHGMLLHLRNKKGEHKNSYVNANTLFHVDFNYLIGNLNGHQFFSDESLRDLIDKSGFTLQPPDPGNDLSITLVLQRPFPSTYTLENLKSSRHSEMSRAPEYMLQLLTESGVLKGLVPEETMARIRKRQYPEAPSLQNPDSLSSTSREAEAELVPPFPLQHAASPVPLEARAQFPSYSYASNVGLPSSVATQHISTSENSLETTPLLPVTNPCLQSRDGNNGDTPYESANSSRTPDWRRRIVTCVVLGVFVGIVYFGTRMHSS